MELKLVQIHKIDTADVYKLTLEYGKQEIHGTVSVYKNIVEYVEYDENLDRILHKNLGNAKILNSAIFKNHKNISIDLPLLIGDF